MTRSCDPLYSPAGDWARGAVLAAAGCAAIWLHQPPWLAGLLLPLAVLTVAVPAYLRGRLERKEREARRA